jgi:hypothetical protein
MSAAFIYTQQDLKPTSPDNGTTEISPNTTPRCNKPIQLSLQRYAPIATQSLRSYSEPRSLVDWTARGAQASVVLKSSSDYQLAVSYSYLSAQLTDIHAQPDSRGRVDRE